MRLIQPGLRTATIATLTVLALSVPQAATGRPTSDGASVAMTSGQLDLLGCTATTPVASLSPSLTSAAVTTTVTCSVGIVPIATVPITQSADGADCDLPTFDTPVVDPLTGEVTISSAFECAADAQGNVDYGFAADIRLPAGIVVANGSTSNSVSAQAGKRFAITFSSKVNAQDPLAPQKQEMSAQPQQISDTSGITVLMATVDPIPVLYPIMIETLNIDLAVEQLSIP